jgi:hypothetical protein
MGVTRFTKKEESHPFIGRWHILEMEMWDEDYFNMETRAYVKIEATNEGEFQFGLVRGYLDGYLEELKDGERFSFTWEGQDEMDEVNGSGWLQLVGPDEIEGLINLHQGDRSKFKAKRA